MKGYLQDFLGSCYNNLMEAAQEDINKNGADAQEFDKFHFFRLAAFMIQICRLQAYEAHKKTKRAAFEAAPTNSKGQKIVQKVAFRLTIGEIGSTVSLSAFDFLYAGMYQATK